MITLKHSWDLQPFLDSSWDWGRGGRACGRQGAAVTGRDPSESVSVSWLSRAWWQSTAAGRAVAAGLFLARITRLAPAPPGAADMFDNSHYPFNCFNYDGDGYPSSSTDEEKKMCRPAYRYGPFSRRPAK